MYSLESEKLSIFRVYVIGKISVLLPIVIITSDTGIRIDLKKNIKHASSKTQGKDSTRFDCKNFFTKLSNRTQMTPKTE